MHVFMYTYMYIYVYMYTYIYVCMYLNLESQQHRRLQTTPHYVKPQLHRPESLNGVVLPLNTRAASSLTQMDTEVSYTSRK